jgi:DNA-binding MarR family transcriptional regulator
MQLLETIPLRSVPAFYQHAYDRILYLKTPAETPARLLKAIGLFNVITAQLGRKPGATLSGIATAIGMTYQGLLKTARYLEKIGLVVVNPLAVPTPFVRHKQHTERRIEDLSQRYPRPLRFECFRQMDASDAPAMWQMTYDALLDQRGPRDTSAKALTCMGLLNIMARMSAHKVLITKASLAARLDMTAHALTDHVDYLRGLGLIAITEQRSRACNAREYRIELPAPIIEHCNATLRQLERFFRHPGWEDAAHLRRMAHEHRRQVLASRQEIFFPLRPIRVEGRNRL